MTCKAYIQTPFDISDRDFFPIDVDFPDVDIAVSNVGTFGSIYTMWHKVKPRIDAFYSSLAPIPSRIKDRVSDMLEGIMMEHSVSLFSLVSGILPDDYNPPKYIGEFELDVDPKEEVSMYKNMSEVSVQLRCLAEYPKMTS